MLKPIIAGVAFAFAAFIIGAGIYAGRGRKL